MPGLRDMAFRTEGFGEPKVLLPGVSLAGISVLAARTKTLIRHPPPSRRYVTGVPLSLGVCGAENGSSIDQREAVNTAYPLP